MSETNQISTNEARRHFFMEISFDGTDYQGWQSQPHGNTVQQIIEQKLRGLFAQDKITLHSSGRTDAHVHAIGMGATFSAPPCPYIPEEKVFYALNRLLPASIRIRSLRPVAPSFHARFSALGKAYTYIINTGESSPFLARYSWHLRHCYALGALRQALTHLEGEHDFSSFAVKNKIYEDTVRTIYRIDLQTFGSLLCLTFVGNGFLYKMIRTMVGTLAKVATGRMHPDEVHKILLLRNRVEAEDTCPPSGLFLMKVFYEENELHQFRISQPPFYY